MHSESAQEPMDSKKILSIVEKIESLLPSGETKISQDIKENLKNLLEDHLHKLDLVTREEFDVQKEVLLKTRKKIEELEKKLSK